MWQRYRSLLISLIALCLSVAIAHWWCRPQAFSPTSLFLSHEQRERVHALRSKYGVPGLSVVVVASPSYKSPTRSRAGLGLDDWKTEIISSGIATPRGSPVNGDTLFAIGSNSKFFTALALGMLIEDRTLLPNGRPLEWTTRISDIFDEWKTVNSGEAAEITIFDFLTMTSGIPFHGLSPKHMNGSELLRMVAHLPRSALAGHTFQYFNHGYVILAQLINRLTAKPLSRLLDERIFKPLKMESVFHDTLLIKEKEKRSHSFYRVGRNMSHCADQDSDATEMDHGCLGAVKSIGWWTKGSGAHEEGCANLVMSSKDIVLWLRELLGPQIIPASVIEACLTPRIPTTDPAQCQLQGAPYGFGKWIGSYRSHRVNSHYGYQVGQFSLFLSAPQDGVALAILCNEAEIGWLVSEIIAYHIMDELLGLEYVEWEREVMDDECKSAANRSSSQTQNHQSPRPEDLPTVIGVYQHPAYGILNLRAFQPQSADRDLADQLSSQIDFDSGATGISIAKLNDREDVHLLLRSQDGRNATWTVFQRFDDHLTDRVEKNSIVIQLQQGSAVVTARGIGMFDNFWGANGVPERTVDWEDVQGSAEVWFQAW